MAFIHVPSKIASDPMKLTLLSFRAKLYMPSTLNTDYQLWCTQMIVCATVNSQCLEYLGYITLPAI